MGDKTFLDIPVTGPLDTSNPSTNRARGVLRAAVDSAPRWLGPRLGGRQQTWVGRAPSSRRVFMGATPDFQFDGTNTYVKGTLSAEQVSLGNKWTLDIAWHAFAARATANAVQVFQWATLTGPVNAIEVGHYGSAHLTSANKAYAIVKTTDSAGTVTNTYTLVGGTVPFAAQSSLVSGGAITRYFMRLVRNGTTLTLLDSTGASTSNTSLVATETHVGTGGSWYYGRETGLGVSTTFNGILLRSVLRDVAASTSAPLPAVEHCFPRSRSVRFGTSSSLIGNASHVQDYSSFGSHGVVSSLQAIGTTGDNHYPLARFVQGFGSFTDRDGLAASVAMVGGGLCVMRQR